MKTRSEATKAERPLDRLVRLLCPWKRPKRRDLRFVSYAEVDMLVRKGWTIAREEDGNRALGMELLEGAKCESCKRGYNGTHGNGYQPCGCEQPNKSYPER